MQGIAFGGSEANGSAVGESRPLPVATYGTYTVSTVWSDGARYADIVSGGTANADWNEGPIFFGKVADGTFYPLAITAERFMRSTAYEQTDGIYSGGTFYPIQFAIISAATAGNTLINAGTAGKLMKVLSYNYVAAGTNVVHFQSGTLAVSGPTSCAANGGKVCNHNPLGWFQTFGSQALNINLASAGSVGGELTFITI